MKPSTFLSLPTAFLLSSSGLQAQATDINPSLSVAASKVDLAGSHIELNRVDGDIELITSYLEKFIEVAKESGEPVPENFNVKDVIAISGLGDIKSFAKSSTFKKDIWHNQAYIENGGSNKGLFALLGGKASTFKAPNMSPLGTDLALQFSLDLSQSPELVRSLAASMGESEQANNELKKEIDPLGLTIEAALKKSNATFNLAIDFDSNTKLDMGDISVDRPAIVGRIDGLNWIWQELGDELIQSNELPMTRTEDAGVVTYKLPDTFKDMLQGYLPIIVVDNNKNQLWVATSEAFLNRARKTGSQLTDDPAFQATWIDMPAKGNSMAYISKEFMSDLESIYTTAVKEDWIDDEGFKAAQPLIGMFVKQLTQSNNGFAFSIAKDDQGLHFANKTPFPAKYGEWIQALASMENYTNDDSENCDGEEGEEEEEE